MAASEFQFRIHTSRRSVLLAFGAAYVVIAAIGIFVPYEPHWPTLGLLTVFFAFICGLIIIFPPRGAALDSIAFESQCLVVIPSPAKRKWLGDQPLKFPFQAQNTIIVRQLTVRGANFGYAVVLSDQAGVETVLIELPSMYVQPR